jgi:zinc transporter ZupT
VSAALSSPWSWSSGTLVSLLATAVGILSALPAFGRRADLARMAGLVPFSGGLLVGIALFGVLPELSEAYRWGGAVALVSAGVALLWLIGRYVYPVCPSCSHTHRHELCETALHGFATPVAVAAAIHALLDGVGIAASYEESAPGLGTAVLVAVMLHKVPEGIALGVMLRAALPARLAALALCAAAEGATFLGALLESLLGPRLGGGWTQYALALAGGSFLYLGFHAAHGDWKRRGAPALWLAGAGAAGAASLQQGLRLLLR